MIIKTDKGVFDMPTDMSAQVSETNPMFNDIGTMTVPVTVPPTKNNLAISGFSCYLTSANDVNNPRQRCRVECGSWQRSGVLNYVSASRKEGITFNIGFDNSEAYAEWKNSTLKDVAVRVGSVSDFADMAALKAYVNNLYTSADSQADPYAVFPIAVARGDGNYYEVLNEVRNGALLWPSTVKRNIDGTLTDVTVPEGYGVTLFARVGYILELVFKGLGCSLSGNPFTADRELSRVVVLNNVADCCCRGQFSDVDLMPDCTVEAFMHSLYVRFGLVFSVRNGVARLRLIRDILAQDPAGKTDLTDYAMGVHSVNFDTPKQLKLSAGRKFDGAAVAAERWADFRRGLGDRPIYHYGSGEQIGIHAGITLIHDCETCQWWYAANVDDPTKITSSGFFDWDAKTEGIEYEELKSEDECVALDRVRVGEAAEEFALHMILPLYLAGSRHYYTYVKGSDKADDESEDMATPLSFLQALTGTDVSRGTIGRIWGRKIGGTPINFLNPDEVPSTLSLLFEFKGGLFDRFWRKYDELLRHGARSVDVDLRLAKHFLSNIDVFSLYGLGGVCCLIDKFDYSLTAARALSVSARLRILQTVGTYDIDAEQGVADVLRHVGGS